MKGSLIILAGLVLSAVALDAGAQTKSANPADKDFPTTLQPVNPVKYYGPRKKKKNKKKSRTYDARDEYYQRVEQAWKEREKRERVTSLNGGVDYMKPPYFGHKKPPKIRPIEKRKYCKICGIRH